MPSEPEYTLPELASITGVTPRTVRYYIAMGLLPSPGQGGPGTRYGEDHLRRVQLIRKLQDQHQPLAEIRSRLAGMDDADVATALEAGHRVGEVSSALDYIRSLSTRAFDTPAAAPSPPGAPPPPSLPSPDASTPGRPPAPAPTTRSTWERIPLSPDVELHIRRPLARLDNKRVERLITIAREILQEDPS